MELFAPLSLVFLCFPRLVARAVVLCQKWVTQKNIAHHQAAIARYARIAGALYLVLTVAHMVFRLKQR